MTGGLDIGGKGSSNIWLYLRSNSTGGSATVLYLTIYSSKLILWLTFIDLVEALFSGLLGDTLTFGIITF